MRTQSSTGKGDRFERRIYDILENILKDGSFFISSSNYKLLQKPKYYSRDRQADIIVDLSIEYFRPGSEKPSLYVLIECKDYNKQIPIDDLEEFYAKTIQITGANVKAILFTTSSLQQGAFNYAVSKGIGVVRILENDKLDWVNERSAPYFSTNKHSANIMKVMNALITEQFMSQHDDTFALNNLNAYTDLNALFEDLLREE